jgi:hypothetical protein
MTHLENLDRAELVRLERMRRCHEQDRPTPREVAAAVATLGESPRPRRQHRITRTFAVAAVVSFSTLGAVAATEKLGLTTLIARWHAPPTSSEAPRVAAPPASPPRGGERPSQALPKAAPDGSGAASEPSATAPRRAGSGPRAPEAPPAGSGTAEAWSKAATALRLGDHAAAQDALRELAGSEDEETRAAALLTRAELDLVNGEEARARAVLSALAERGATPFVRARARQILAGER